MFMIAVEATIVSTAMPQIAGQLGDLHLYAWVFSAFLLTQTATTVVFGKLADLFGRKPVLLAGIAVFLIGSVLCGAAWSMPSLIAFRLLQGIGAGAIQPIGMTVIGDLYTVEERGRIQGWLASVWGISSVLGPLAGGFIIQHANWSWIFWINVPVGLAAAGLFAFCLHENVATRARHIDAAGAALFATTVAAAMVAITQAGTGDVRTASMAAALAIASAVLFVLAERRAKDPMVAFAMWAKRSIATSNATCMLSGMAVVGLTAFLPMYVQGVMGRTPIEAGFALTAMVLGWPIGATAAGRLFGRLGLRTTLLIGAALLPTGTLAFITLGPLSSPVLAGVGSLVMGLGMGFLTTSAIVIVQDSVGWNERGSATASNLFSRNLGSTLGATVLGGVLNAGLAHAGGHGFDLDQVRQLLDHPGPLAGTDDIAAALGHALHVTFWAVFGIAATTLAVATLVPAIKLSQTVKVEAGAD